MTVKGRNYLTTLEGLISLMVEERDIEKKRLRAYGLSEDLNEGKSSLICA
jgi:hypothetical protein